MPRVSSCPDVRNAVLEAAINLMQRFGYKKMTIDDIATECGIGKATLYGYFENKQEVGLAVLDYYHRTIQDRWKNILARSVSSSEKLRLMIRERVLYLFDVATLHRQSMDDCLAALRPLLLSRRDLYAEQESKLLSEVLVEGVRSGEFVLGGLPDPDPLLVARSILICTGGLMPLNLSPKELASREQVSEMTRRVTDLLLASLTQSPHLYLPGGDFPLALSICQE
jgi:AcrR family transcriptional regulator